MLASTLRLTARITWGLLCAEQLLGYTASAQANDRIREIIQNVRANEALYENIEVRMVEQYRIIDRKPSIGEAGPNKAYEMGAVDKDVRYVSQNGMFRVDVEGRGTTAENTLSEDRIRMFDGQTTRLLDQKQIGNIIAGRKNDSNFIWPHMLLLHDSYPTVPLSIYLQGHTAMAAHPDIKWNPNHTEEITYQGEAEFQSLKCHRVSITINVPHNGGVVAYTRAELWLAEERNYIPVRRLVYAFRWSRTLPLKEGTVSSFRELEPGVWFPVAATVMQYDDIALRDAKRQKPYGRYSYEVKDVSLNPNYDISFFRDLTLPSGTAVYEVEGGNIVKSYAVGQEGDPGQRRSYWWILWLNVAVVLAIVSAVYIRHRRKRREVAG